MRLPRFHYSQAISLAEMGLYAIVGARSDDGYISNSGANYVVPVTPH